MTLRTKISLICECGHEGAILMSENDQPYSTMWERYTLENFHGGSVRVEGLDEVDDLIETLKPMCPFCCSTKISFKSNKY